MSIEAFGDEQTFETVFPITPRYFVPTKDEINARVGQVYMHTAAAFAVTCATALFSSFAGLAGRVAAVVVGSPLLSTLGMCAVVVSLVVAILRTPTSNSATKQGLFGLLSVCEGIALSPLVLLNAPACAVAAAATVGLTGALGIAATKMKVQFERYEKILWVALAVIGVAALGAAFLPAVAAAGIAHNISIFGGLALFSAFVVYDIQQARKDAASPSFDPINHSVNLYFDVLNIALRIFDLYNRYVRNN